MNVADGGTVTGGVLVLSGPPCAGKSTVGRAFAADSSVHGWVYVEVDAVFSLLLPDSDRSRSDRMLAYDAAHRVAGMLVERGKNVLLECTYARVEQRASLVAALADVSHVPVRVVEFFISPDDAVRRFRQRSQATDLDEELVRERVAAFPYSDQVRRVPASDTTPADLARELATWVRCAPAPVRRETWVEAGRGWD